MNQPPSRLRLLLIPLLVVYSLAILFYLFRMNPLLFSKTSLESQIVKAKSTQRHPIPTLENVDMDIPEIAKASLRMNLQRTGAHAYPQRVYWRNKISEVRPIVNSDGLEEKTYEKPNMIISDSDIYVTDSQSDVIRTDLAGNLVWRFSVSPELAGYSKKNNVSGNISLTQNYVFFGTTGGVLYSLNTSNGHLRWMISLEHSIKNSPLVFDGKIFVNLYDEQTSNSYISCHELATGKRLWLSKSLDHELTSEFSAHKSLKAIYVGDSHGQLLAFDIKEGKKLWQFSSLGSVHGAPTIVGEKIFFANVEAEVFALKAKDGEKIWEFKLSSGTKNALTYVPKYNMLAVMTDNGYLHTIKVRSGEGKWRFNTRVAGQSGDVTAVRLDNSSIVKLELIWAYEGWVIIAPCVGNRLCVFNPKEGALIARYNLGGAIGSFPKFNGKEMFVLVKGAKLKSDPTREITEAKDIKTPEWAMAKLVVNKPKKPKPAPPAEASEEKKE